MAAISVPRGTILSSRRRVCAPMRVIHTLRMPQRNFLRISGPIFDSLEDKSTGSEMVQHSYISLTPLLIPPKESVGSETLHAYISTNPLLIPPTNKHFVLSLPVPLFKLIASSIYIPIYFSEIILVISVATY